MKTICVLVILFSFFASYSKETIKKQRITGIFGQTFGTVVKSKKTFEDFSENKTTISNIHLLPIKHQTKYLKNNYYDKNLYFYQSLGYKPYGRQDILSYFYD